MFYYISARLVGHRDRDAARLGATLPLGADADLVHQQLDDLALAGQLRRAVWHCLDRVNVAAQFRERRRLLRKASFLEGGQVITQAQRL